MPYVIDMMNRADGDEPYGIPPGWYFSITRGAEFAHNHRADYDAEWLRTAFPHHVHADMTQAFEAWWWDRHFFVAAWIGMARFQVGDDLAMEFRIAWT